MQKGAAAAAAVFGLAVLDATASVAAIRPLRLRCSPGLSGIGNPGHVALTFDDGPHPVATPRFLDALARLEVRATFFVLGEQLRRQPELARRMVSEGHEIAVHGFQHRPHLLRAAPAVAVDIARARTEVEQLVGTTPRFWRPPHGIPTAAGLLTAMRLGMRPVLWSAEAREWRSGASAASSLRLLRGQLAGGGVVLMHDSDAAMRRDAWHVTLALLPELVEWCSSQGWQVGPLREHGLSATPGTRPISTSPARDLVEVGGQLCA